ncbi:MAG: hypothetical protein ABI162_04825, partial [Luteolibacter sp.]
AGVWSVRAWISPPAWGWPEALERGAQPGMDFPTRVGMARPRRPRLPIRHRFPHPRGDGPSGENCGAEDGQISPPL